MASGKSNLSDLDFERDMPLTEADFDAMERARQLRPLSPEAERAWLELLEKHHPAALNSDSDEPFTLP